MKMFIVARLINLLDTTPLVKAEISACALYGVKYGDKVNLVQKFNSCKNKHLSNKLKKTKKHYLHSSVFTK